MNWILSVWARHLARRRLLKERRILLEKLCRVTRLESVYDIRARLYEIDKRLKDRT